MHNFTLASPPIPNIKGPRVIPHPLHEVNFLMVEIPPPKPYIFMIRVTRQIKCIIAQAPGSYHTPYLKIINIYGLGVGISTIKKFTLGRGWGMTLGPEL
jgi:hypothetical protein